MFSLIGFCVDFKFGFSAISYFNALLCRHDHEGAEDAEMGLFPTLIHLTSTNEFQTIGC